MVPGAGIEPALLSEEDFKSSVSAIPPSGQHLYKIVAVYLIFKGKTIFIINAGPISGTKNTPLSD